MTTILLLGASGNVGSEFLSQLSEDPMVTVVAPSRTEFSLLGHGATILAYLRSCAPDIIINCAAWTDVVGAEYENNAEKVYALNATLWDKILPYANTKNVRVVHFSTDYVFGGDDWSPRVETDVARPMTQYGRSKLIGETALLDRADNCLVIRTSSLYGRTASTSHKRSFLDHLKIGNLHTIDCRLRMTPTPIPRLVELVIHNLLYRNDLQGLFHMTPQGSCTWYEFANYVKTIAKLPITITPTVVPHDAVPRPLYTVLENERLRYNGLDHFAHWTIEATRLLKSGRLL